MLYDFYDFCRGGNGYRGIVPFLHTNTSQAITRTYTTSVHSPSGLTDTLLKALSLPSLKSSNTCRTSFRLWSNLLKVNNADIPIILITIHFGDLHSLNSENANEIKLNIHAHTKPNYSDLKLYLSPKIWFGSWC